MDVLLGKKSLTDAVISEIMDSIWEEILSFLWSSRLAGQFLFATALCASVKSIRRPRPAPEDSVIVITGCDSGFGAITAEYLVNLGYHVIATCLTADGVTAIGKKGVDLALRCDVTSPEDVARLASETDALIKERKLSLWTVVNNAGIGEAGFLDWTEVDRYRRVMEVNYFGTLSVTKALLPLLKRTRESRVINISSMAGHFSGPGMGGYSASKHAVEGLAKALRAELRPWNIHVANINPGFMSTPLVKSVADTSLQIYRQAPVSIRNQYDGEKFLPALIKTTVPFTEDPRIVSDAIYSLIIAKEPALNTFPGYQAFLLRFATTVPHFIVELFTYISHRTGTYYGPNPEVLEEIQGYQGPV